jgi:hypothetical protein
MRPIKALRRGAPVLVAGAALVALTACEAPSYRFSASPSDDLVVKIPRSWSTVRSGVPANSDGTPGQTGSWLAVYDAEPHPSVTHLLATHTTAPVALIRSYVVPAGQGSSISDDDLRDVLLPVTESGRADALAQGFLATNFRLLTNEAINTKTAHGVHVVFSYDLGGGSEVFDKVAVTDQHRTRVHVFLVQCSQACFTHDNAAIAGAVRSFTVRVP